MIPPAAPICGYRPRASATRPCSPRHERSCSASDTPSARSTRRHSTPIAIASHSCCCFTPSPTALSKKRREARSAVTEANSSLRSAVRSKASSPLDQIARLHRHDVVPTRIPQAGATRDDPEIRTRLRHALVEIGLEERQLLIGSDGRRKFHLQTQHRRGLQLMRVPRIDQGRNRVGVAGRSAQPAHHGLTTGFLVQVKGLRVPLSSESHDLVSRRRMPPDFELSPRYDIFEVVHGRRNSAIQEDRPSLRSGSTRPEVPRPARALQPGVRARRPTTAPRPH